MVSNYGSFSGEFKFKDSILMASTDGVGTKSILLNKVFGLNGFEILGQDLVNHNINDILVNGGYPLFFLKDYYGCNNFNHQVNSLLLLVVLLNLVKIIILFYLVVKLQL